VLTPADEAGALLVADKMLAAIAKPFTVDALALRVTASIGIALFPEHADDANELIQRADMAMYRAKAARTGREIYVAGPAIDRVARLALATELAHAIKNGELEVLYQPQADARTQHLVAMEALVRWRHPERGLLEPFNFIDVAEQAGLVRALTREVLELGLDQLRAWRASSAPLRLAVNVTVADLLDSRFPSELHWALLQRGLPPEALTLEFTENAAAADPLRVGAVLSHLRDLGVGLSLDDFGSGPTSLNALRSIPVNEVKVDRQIIAKAATDPIDKAIVRSTVTLARELGMRVVAEGVEDTHTAQAISEAGCDLIQGYLLSKPLPATDLSELITVRTRRGHPAIAR
jgi:predicted signal transduction protein with EAL and GGDEF domain